MFDDGESGEQEHPLAAIARRTEEIRTELAALAGNLRELGEGDSALKTHAGHLERAASALHTPVYYLSKKANGSPSTDIQAPVNAAPAIHSSASDRTPAASTAGYPVFTKEGQKCARYQVKGFDSVIQVLRLLSHGVHYLKTQQKDKVVYIFPLQEDGTSPILVTHKGTFGASATRIDDEGQKNDDFVHSLTADEWREAENIARKQAPRVLAVS